MTEPRCPVLVRRAACALLAACAPLAGCGDDGALGPGAPVELGAHYVAVANASFDFQTGTIGAVRLPELSAAADLGALHSDSVLRYSGGLLFGINRRGGDNLQLLDRASMGTRWQRSVEAGSNPQDVAVFAPNRAYVSRYERADLWIVDPSAGDAAFVVGTVDLSAHADADGIPEAGAMAVDEAGGVTWLALQRLDRDAGFLPLNESRLVRIDHASGAITEAVALPTPNPQALFLRDGVLWIPCSGFTNESDGAVERYDVASGRFLEPALLESDVGGDITAIAPGDPVLVVWSDADFASHLSVFEPVTGVEVARLAEDLGYVADVARTGDFVLVPDRSRDSPGLRVFDVETFEEVAGSPFSTGLPPWSLAVVE